MDSEADYQAVKAIVIRNGGIISQREIFSVTVRGYSKLGRIVARLEQEGYLIKDGYYIDEEDRPMI